jgi:hypothetical protein
LALGQLAYLRRPVVQLQFVQPANLESSTCHYPDRPITARRSEHGQDRLTRPAAVCATGAAGYGRAVPGSRTTHCRLPAFFRDRPGDPSEKARWFTRARPTPPAGPAGVD